MRAFVALGLAGCVIRNDITHVVLRDPARVAVANILPIGAARGDIPATVPPYIGSAEIGSWVERDGSDASDPLEPATPAALVAWCPKCIGTRRLVVVDRPALELRGTADELLHWDGDDLHIRWIFDAARRRGRHYIHEPHIALDLVTPRSNVESIDYEAHVQRQSDDGPFEIGGMVWMGVWAAGGGALLGVGVHEHEIGLDVAGGAMIAIGVTVMSLLVREYRARDEHHPIRVR
jgi:hypothetical protein